MGANLLFIRTRHTKIKTNLSAIAVAFLKRTNHWPQIVAELKSCKNPWISHFRWLLIHCEFCFFLSFSFFSFGWQILKRNYSIFSCLVMASSDTECIVSFNSPVPLQQFTIMNLTMLNALATHTTRGDRPFGKDKTATCLSRLLNAFDVKQVPFIMMTCCTYL